MSSPAVTYTCNLFLIYHPALEKRSPVCFSTFGKDGLVIANLRVGKFQNELAAPGAMNYSLEKFISRT